jgi:hypothetical protein
VDLYEAAKKARERADRSLDPADHSVAAALEGWLDAEARQQLAELKPPPPDPASFPTPEELGYVSEVRIERPEREN